MKSILLGLTAAALLGFSSMTLADDLDNPDVNAAIMEQNAQSDMGDPSLTGDDTNGVTDQTPIPGDNATNMQPDATQGSGDNSSSTATDNSDNQSSSTDNSENAVEQTDDDNNINTQ